MKTRLPLDRVLSMCSSARYADVAVPDWCFDAWPEAGVQQGGFDAACAALTEAGSKDAPDGRLCWTGTAHHHPSRMNLMQLAAQHPTRFACENVADRRLSAKSGVSVAPSDPQFRTLAEQVGRYRYLLDVQGKGYSSRLKLLLHSGRAVFVVRSPWSEYYYAQLSPWVHYIPVRENLTDLVDRLDWADNHSEEVATIAATAQAFARSHLTEKAALSALRMALVTGSTAVGGSQVGELEDDDIQLMRGDWATNRAVTRK
jgi:hypothetical protein